MPLKVQFLKVGAAGVGSEFGISMSSFCRRSKLNDGNLFLRYYFFNYFHLSLRRVQVGRRLPRQIPDRCLQFL